MPFLILTLWILPFLPSKFDLKTTLDFWSDPVHRQCLKGLPQKSQFLSLYAALLCGENLPLSHWRTLFQTLGLYHVLVVSGAHLLVLKRWMSPLQKTQGAWGPLLSHLILFIYCLACGANPPVFRAFLQGLLEDVARTRKWSWTAPQRSFISGIATLALVPSWIHSLSFHLSWTAAMAVGWAHTWTRTWNQRPSWLISLLTSWLMIPALMGWTSVHPMGWLTNWLLAPLLGEWFLLLNALGCLLNFCTQVCDEIWAILLSALEYGVKLISFQKSYPVCRTWLLVYVWLLQTLWLFYLWQQKKKTK